MSANPSTTTIADALYESYAAAKEARIKDQLGFILHGTIQVRFNQPKWMPYRLFLWLMRRVIVIEDGPTVTAK